MSFFQEFGDVEVALDTLLRPQGEYARGVESTSRAHRDVAMKALYAEIRAYGDRRVKSDHPIVKSNYVDLDRQHQMQRAASAAVDKAHGKYVVSSGLGQLIGLGATATQEEQS